MVRTVPRLIKRVSLQGPMSPIGPACMYQYILSLGVAVSLQDSASAGEVGACRGWRKKDGAAEREKWSLVINRCFRISNAISRASG